VFDPGVSEEDRVMAAASESVLEKPQGGLVVRPSTENDVAAMIAIYTHHITRGLGDVDIEPTQADDIKRRRKNMLRRRLPHLAAERDGMIVGYAYAVPFRKRPAYRYAVKHSIYVHPGHVGTGIGRQLLPALIEACASAGYRQMFAYVDADNVASLSLHEAHGFRRVGLLEGVGFKYGKWADSVLMQRAIGAGASTPPVEIAYSRTT
jgi:L-amino acid N-acyltransferase YncA